MNTPEYEHRIIERYAESLYRKAGQLPKVSAAMGAVVGLLVGALPFTSFLVTPVPKSFGYSTILLGIIVGGLIGYVIGDGRSFSYLLQAQQALCQVQTERNTAAAARAAMTRAAAPVRAAAPQAPAPVQPAPAPPAPPVVQAPVLPSQLRTPVPAAASGGSAAAMPPVSPPRAS